MNGTFSPSRSATPPPELEPLLTQARAAHATGRLDAARELFDHALAHDPDHAEALKASADVLLRLGRTGQALERFERALAYDPKDAWLLHNRGVVLAQNGRFEAAVSSYDAALDVRPDYMLAHFNRGAALMSLDRPKEALESYGRALAIEPRQPMVLNNRGVALRALGRPEEALADFEAALQAFPNGAEIHNNRGQALQALGRPIEALASYDAAIALNPRFAEAHDNRGLLLAQLGRRDEACATLERAIALGPDRPRFYYHLAVTGGLDPDGPHPKAMRTLLGRPLQPDDEVELRFALARALADAGEASQTFEQLLAGNAVKRRRSAYDEAAALEALDQVRLAFTSERVGAAAGGEPSEAPVFIVGMPRCGSTLIEQILASHPMVAAIGETDDLGDAVSASGAAVPKAVAGLAAEQLRALGRRYLDAVSAKAPAAARIIDKTLDNFRFAGLIHMALPNARIVHVSRDPVDTCVSCFSQLFGGDIPYAYDLAELGRYYRAYEGLMAHWRQMLPAETLIELRYEALVQDLEGQARRLLGHLGLEWDPRCLDFHKTERRVQTLSLSQVRRPLYASAVGASRAYAPFLGPLLEALGPDRAPT
jgi:tetratricopeptide (TPR) repeat protein